MNLRKLARGKPCQIRLPEICNFDETTTVLAHIRLPGITGGNVKSPDVIAAWACSACHDAVDRRRFLDLEHDYVRLCHLEGVARTQYKLVKEGVLKW